MGFKLLHEDYNFILLYEVIFRDFVDLESRQNHQDNCLNLLNIYWLCFPYKIHPVDFKIIFYNFLN